MKRGQRGFALVEMLITLAVTGIVVGVLGTSIYQVVSSTDYGNDSITATHELQNAAHWVSHDGQAASAASGGSTLVLTMPDSSTVSYSLADGELRRSDGSSEMTLAQNISAASFSVAGRTITMTITSSPPGRWNVSQERTYKVNLRPT